MAKLTQEMFFAKLKVFEGQVLSVQEMMKIAELDPSQQGTFHQWLHRLSCPENNKQRLLKPQGRGAYKVVRLVEPIRKLSSEPKSPIEILFPYGRDDGSKFDFEDVLEVDEGDAIVIAGVSNTAKTAWVINMLALNIENHPCVLMGNEYARGDRTLSPKFERRMRRMDWANWENGEGELKFDILPVSDDYEDNVVPGKINFIDWINLADNFFQIGQIIKDIKYKVCNGLAVIVIQKGEGNLLGRGKDFSRDLADFYITIDPIDAMDKKLTIVKAKAASGYFLDGKTWAFQIVEGGTQFHNIREVKNCFRCHGKRTIWDNSGHTYKKCDKCEGKGVVNIDE